ncbi:MAG: FTR1 family protein [Thermodesulfobacteriota bacterium]
MLAGMLITIREGVEAFLITGILLVYLKKVGYASLEKYVWAGTILGVIISIALALAFQTLAIQFEGPGAAIFEALASIIAIPILSYMLIWMQGQSTSIKGDIEVKAEMFTYSGRVLPLAFLAFVTVLREGLETALFLTALSSRAAGSGLLLGAALGLVIAAAIVYLIFVSTVRLNLGTFFAVTGALLLFVAAGLVSHVFMALQEVGFPPIIANIWSTKHIIDAEGLVGRLLHAFVGYHDEPSLIQALAYFTYLGVMGWAFIRKVRLTRQRK